MSYGFALTALSSSAPKVLVGEKELIILRREPQDPQLVNGFLYLRFGKNRVKQKRCIEGYLYKQKIPNPDVS